jgi:hypothetical protein
MAFLRGKSTSASRALKRSRTPQPERQRLATPRSSRSQSDPAAVQATAAQGIAGGGDPLPHRDIIQRAFGHHDVGAVQAHVGGEAATASRAIGAEAYATGSHVAFARAPSLHTAAHVVQQRGGVQLKGGVGAVEKHAVLVPTAGGARLANQLDTVASGEEPDRAQRQVVVASIFDRQCGAEPIPLAVRCESDGAIVPAARRRRNTTTLLVLPNRPSACATGAAGRPIG